MLSGYVSIAKWLSKSLFSLFDQFVFSGSNFLYLIILARLFSQTDYGGFSIVYSIYLFLFGINNSFIVDPMNNVGLGSFLNTKREYINLLILTQTAIGLFFSLVIFGLSEIFVPRNEIRESLNGISLTITPLLLYFTVRRVCYMHQLQRMTFISGILFTAALFSQLYLLYIGNDLSPFSSFLILGTSNLVGFLFLYMFLIVRFRGSVKITRTLLRQLIAKHWSLGRWILYISVISWLSYNIYIPLVGLIGRIESSAQLKALENVLLPVEQLITSVSVYFLPIFLIHYNTDKSVIRLRNSAEKLNMILVIITAAFLFFLLLLGENILMLIYNTEIYASNWLLLPALCIVPLIRILSDVRLGIPLRVLGRFDAFLLPTAAASIVSFFAGLPLLYFFDVSGAVLGKVLSAIIYLSFLHYKTRI